MFPLEPYVICYLLLPHILYLKCSDHYRIIAHCILHILLAPHNPLSPTHHASFLSIYPCIIISLNFPAHIVFFISYFTHPPLSHAYNPDRLFIPRILLPPTPLYLTYLSSLFLIVVAVRFIFMYCTACSSDWNPKSFPPYRASCVTCDGVPYSVAGSSKQNPIGSRLVSQCPGLFSSRLVLALLHGVMSGEMGCGDLVYSFPHNVNLFLRHRVGDFSFRIDDTIAT